MAKKCDDCKVLAQQMLNQGNKSLNSAHDKLTLGNLKMAAQATHMTLKRKRTKLGYGLSGGFVGKVLSIAYAEVDKMAGTANKPVTHQWWTWLNLGTALIGGTLLATDFVKLSEDEFQLVLGATTVTATELVDQVEGLMGQAGLTRQGFGRGGPSYHKVSQRPMQRQPMQYSGGYGGAVPSASGYREFS